MAGIGTQQMEDFREQASMAVATSMVASVEEQRKKDKEIPRKYPPPVVRSVILIQACLRRKGFLRSFGATENDEELAELAPPPPLTAVALYMCRRMRNPTFVPVEKEANIVAGILVAKEKGISMDVIANVIWFYEGVLPDDHTALITLNEKLQKLVIDAYEKLQEALNRCATPAEVRAAVDDARRTYQVLPELEAEVFSCADKAMKEAIEKAEDEMKAMIKKSVTTLEYKECERELERLFGPVETHLRDDLEVACLRRVQFLEMELETRWSRPFAGPLPPHTRAARRYELELGLVPSVQAFIKDERSHAAKLEAQFEVQILALQGRLRNLTQKRKEARVRYVIQDLDQKLVDASSALQRAIEEALVNLGPDNELVTRRARELLALEAHTAVFAMFCETTAEELRTEIEAGDTSPEAADRLRGVASALAGGLLQLNPTHPYQTSLREEFKEELAAVAMNRPEPAAEPESEPPRQPARQPPRAQKELVDVETEAAAPKAALPTATATTSWSEEPAAPQQAAPSWSEEPAATTAMMALPERAETAERPSQRQLLEERKAADDQRAASRQAMRADLQSMKLRQLRARAEQLGATEDELDAADEADQPKAALIELVVEKTLARDQAAVRAATAEPQSRPVTGAALSDLAEEVTTGLVEEAAPQARSVPSTASAAPAAAATPDTGFTMTGAAPQARSVPSTASAAPAAAATPDTGFTMMGTGEVLELPERRGAAEESKPSELTPRAAEARTSLAEALAGGGLAGLFAKPGSAAPAAEPAERPPASAAPPAYTGPVEPIAGMPTSAWLPPPSAEAGPRPGLEPIAPPLKSPGHSTVDEPEFEDTWASPPGYDHVEVRVTEQNKEKAAEERAFKMPGVDIPLTTAEAGPDGDQKIDPNVSMMLQTFDAETLLGEKSAMAPSGITVKLTLQDLTMDVVKLHGEAVFKAKFSRALADAASIPKERITIQGFRPGSVVVDFHIKEPLPGETPPPVEGNRTRGAAPTLKSAEQVFEDLRRQVSDGGSKLRLGEVGPFVSNATLERGVGTTSNKVDQGSLSSAYVAPPIGGRAASETAPLKPSEQTDRNMAWTGSTAPGETMKRGPGMGTTTMTWGAATGAPGMGETQPGPQFRTTCPKDPAKPDMPWATPYQQQEAYTFYDRKPEDVHPPPIHEAPLQTRAPKQKFQQHATFCLTRHPVKGTDAYKDLPVPQSPTIAAAASWLENAEAELKDPGLDSIGTKTDWPDFKDLGKKAKLAKDRKAQQEAEAELEGGKTTGTTVADAIDISEVPSQEASEKTKTSPKKKGLRKTATMRQDTGDPAPEPEPEASGADTDRTSPTSSAAERARRRTALATSKSALASDEDDSPVGDSSSPRSQAKDRRKTYSQGDKDADVDPTSEGDSSDAGSPKPGRAKAKRRGKDNKPLRVVVEEGGHRHEADADGDPRSPSLEESRARSDDRSERGGRTGPSPRTGGRPEASPDRDFQAGRGRKGMDNLRPPAVDTRERGGRGAPSPKSPAAARTPKTPASARPHSEERQPSPFDSVDSAGGAPPSRYVGMLGGIPNTGVRHQTDANNRLPSLVGKPTTDDLRSPAFMYNWYRHETTGVGPPYKTCEAEEHQETPQWTAMQMLDATLDKNDWKRSYSWATRRVGRGQKEWSIRGGSLGPTSSIRTMGARSHSAGQAPRHLPPVVRRPIRGRERRPDPRDRGRDHGREKLPQQAMPTRPTAVGGRERPSSETKPSSKPTTPGIGRPTSQDERPPTRESEKSGGRSKPSTPGSAKTEKETQDPTPGGTGTGVADAIDVSEVPGEEAAAGSQDEQDKADAAAKAEELLGAGKKKKRERVKLREKEQELTPEEQAEKKAAEEKAAKEKIKKEKADKKNKAAKEKIKKDRIQAKEDAKRQAEEEERRKQEEEELKNMPTEEEQKKLEAAAYAERVAQEARERKAKKKKAAEEERVASPELDMSKLDAVFGAVKSQVLAPDGESPEEDKGEEPSSPTAEGASRSTTPAERGDSRASSKSPSPASPSGKAKSKQKGNKKGKKKGAAKDGAESPSPPNTTTSSSSRKDESARETEPETPLSPEEQKAAAEAEEKAQRRASAMARADAELLRILQEEARLAEAIAAQEALDADEEAEVQEGKASIDYAHRVSVRAAQTVTEAEAHTAAVAFVGNTVDHVEAVLLHEKMVWPGELMPEDDGTITAPVTRANTLNLGGTGVSDAIDMDEDGTPASSPLLMGQVWKRRPRSGARAGASPAGRVSWTDGLPEGTEDDMGQRRQTEEGAPTSGTAVADAIDMGEADHRRPRGEFRQSLLTSDWSRLYAGFAPPGHDAEEAPAGKPTGHLIKGNARSSIATGDWAAFDAGADRSALADTAQEADSDHEDGKGPTGEFVFRDTRASIATGDWAALDVEALPSLQEEPPRVRGDFRHSLRPESQAGLYAGFARPRPEVAAQVAPEEQLKPREGDSTGEGRPALQEFSETLEEKPSQPETPQVVTDFSLPLEASTMTNDVVDETEVFPETPIRLSGPSPDFPMSPSVGSWLNRLRLGQTPHEAEDVRSASSRSRLEISTEELRGGPSESFIHSPSVGQWLYAKPPRAGLPRTDEPAEEEFEPSLFPLTPSVGSWLLMAPPGALAALQGPSGTAVGDAIDLGNETFDPSVASWLGEAPEQAREKLDAISGEPTPAGSKSPTQVGDYQEAERARTPFAKSPSVWSWLMTAPPEAPAELVKDIERVIQREPEAPIYVPRPRTPFALSPSVGAWLRKAPLRVCDELEEIASQHSEKQAMPENWKLSPSVGSWYHSLPARAHLAAALEKFREESYERPEFIHSPSVGAWLRSAPARGSLAEALEAIHAASAGTAVADAIDAADTEMAHDFTSNLLRRAEENAQVRRAEMSKRSSALMAPGYTQSLLSRLAERQQPDQLSRPSSAEIARASAIVLTSDLLRRGEENVQERSKKTSHLVAGPYTRLMVRRVIARQLRTQQETEAKSAAIRDADHTQARGDFRGGPRASFSAIHGLFPGRPVTQSQEPGAKQPEDRSDVHGDFRSGPRGSFNAIHGLFPGGPPAAAARPAVSGRSRSPTPRSAIGTEPDDEGSPDLGPRKPAEPSARVDAPFARVDRPAPGLRPTSPSLLPQAAATRHARTNAGATREQVLSFAQSLTSSIFRTSNNLAMQRAASQPQLRRFGTSANATAEPMQRVGQQGPPSPAHLLMGPGQRTMPPTSPTAPSMGTGYGTQQRFGLEQQRTMLPQSRAPGSTGYVTSPMSATSPTAPGLRLPAGSLGDSATPSNTRAPAAPTRRSPTRDGRKPVSPIPAEETAFFF